MMRILPRSTCGLALCVTLAGCAHKEFDVDKTADFASFDSFSVKSAELPANHKTLQGHVDKAIANQLTSKGMKRTSADSAAVNVRYFLTLEDVAAADNEEIKAPGELIVDVQDSLTGDVVWRSRSARAVPVVKGDESVVAESVQQWVTDMLEEYPGAR
jgi:hypothetical protein